MNVDWYTPFPNPTNPNENIRLSSQLPYHYLDEDLWGDYEIGPYIPRYTSLVEFFNDTYENRIRVTPPRRLRWINPLRSSNRRAVRQSLTQWKQYRL